MDKTADLTSGVDCTVFIGIEMKGLVIPVSAPAHKVFMELH